MKKIKIWLLKKNAKIDKSLAKLIRKKNDTNFYYQE